MNRKLFIAPLGVVALAVGAGTAQAQIVGDPHQASLQSGTTNQASNQATGGGIVVGDTGQSVDNGSSTTLGSGQVMGGTVVGTPAQANAQNSVTNQGVNQLANPDGTTVGDTSQSVANSAQTAVIGIQAILGTTIVGSPSQANIQSQVTNQGVNQWSGAGITVGDTAQSVTNSAGTLLLGTQLVFGFGPSTIVGTPRQANAQNSITNQGTNQLTTSGTRVGDLSQSVADGSTTALIAIQGIGGTIVGEPRQANVQNVGTLQFADQKAGTGIIVGDTDQAGSNSQLSIEGHTAIIV